MANNNTSLLIVDDEPDILEFLQYNFEKEKYTVYTASNGQEAIELAKVHEPDLIILDVMMPKMDGVETCRQLRDLPQFANTLIVFLTARKEEYSEIAGFDVGADDYITKPIRPRALLPRIKALLKRKKRLKTEDKILVFKDLSVNIEKRIIILNGKEIKLPKKEFNILYLLASTPEKVFSRAEIYLKVWGNDIIVGDRTLDVHIRKLREKIGSKYINTRKGIGYAFIS